MPFGEGNQNPDCSSDRFEVVRTRPQPPKEGVDEPTLEGPDSVSAGLLLGGVASEVGLGRWMVDSLGGTQASRASTNHPDESGLGTP